MRCRVGAHCLLVAFSLGCAAIAQGPAPPMAPVVPAEPADAGEPTEALLEKAYGLEIAGNLEEAVAAYLEAVFPIPPQEGSWEAALAIARLSDDPAQLGDALMATELLQVNPHVGLSVAQIVLTAKLGQYEELPILLNNILGDMAIGDPIPEPVLLLFEALVSLVETTPEAGAAAIVGLAEVDSPSEGVQRRGLERIEEAAERYPAGALALRALAAMASDDEGKARRQKALRDALEQSAAPGENAAQLAQWVLDLGDASGELEAELAALREQGVPLTLVEAAPKPPPDEENAAVVYQKVFQVGFTPEERDALSAATAGPSLGDLAAAMGLEPMDGARVSAQARNALMGPVGQQVLATLREASQRPHCVFPIRWEEGWSALFPHLAQYRQAARTLTVYSRMLAEDGRMEEALDWCTVSLRIAEHAAEDPVLIGQLVAIAVQAIALHAMQDIISAADISPVQAQALEEYLRGIDMYEPFSAAMVTELAGGSAMYKLVRENPGDAFAMVGNGDAGQAVLARLYYGRVARGVHSADHLAYLRHMQKVVAVSGETYRDAIARGDALEPTQDEVGAFLVAGAIIPGVGKAMQRRDRAIAEIDLCRVALALKAYKAERGAYPQTLAALEESLEGPLPTDPFSGEGFVYEREGEGFRLYSLGQDMDDDGGATRDDEGRDAMDWDIVWRCER